MAKIPEYPLSQQSARLTGGVGQLNAPLLDPGTGSHLSAAGGFVNPGQMRPALAQEVPQVSPPITLNAFEQGGEILARGALEFQDRKDTASAREALLLARTASRNLFMSPGEDGHVQGFGALVGKDAVDAYPQYQEAVQKMYREFGDKLGGNAKAKYISMAFNDLDSDLSRGAEHVVRQQKVHEEQLNFAEFQELRNTQRDAPDAPYTPGVDGILPLQKALAGEKDPDKRMDKANKVFADGVDIVYFKAPEGKKADAVAAFIDKYSAYASPDQVNNQKAFQERIANAEETERKRVAKEAYSMNSVVMATHISSSIMDRLAVGDMNGVKSILTGLTAGAPDAEAKKNSITIFQQGIVDSLDLIKTTGPGRKKAEAAIQALMPYMTDDTKQKVLGTGGLVDRWDTDDRGEAERVDKYRKEEQNSYHAKVRDTGTKLIENGWRPVSRADVLNHVDENGNRPFAALEGDDKYTVVDEIIKYSDHIASGNPTDLEKIRQDVVYPALDNGQIFRSQEDLHRALSGKGIVLKNSDEEQLFKPFKDRMDANKSFLNNREQTITIKLRGKYGAEEVDTPSGVALNPGANSNVQMAQQVLQAFSAASRRDPTPFNQARGRLRSILDLNIPDSEIAKKLDEFEKTEFSTEGASAANLPYQMKEFTRQITPKTAPTPGAGSGDAVLDAAKHIDTVDAGSDQGMQKALADEYGGYVFDSGFQKVLTQRIAETGAAWDEKRKGFYYKDPKTGKPMKIRIRYEP